MNERTMKVYDCDFCKKKYFKKPACARHEEYCYHNPRNKDINSCYNCDFFEKERAYSSYNNTDQPNDEKITITAYYCKKKKIFLHNLKHEVLKTPKTKKVNSQLMHRDGECQFFKHDNSMPF